MIDQSFTSRGALSLSRGSRSSASRSSLEVRDLLQALPRGSTVVCLGCGKDIDALRAIAARHRGIGIEISRARAQHLQGAVPHTPVVQADAADVIFPRRSVDAVISLLSMDRIPAARHAPLFRRVLDWLRPGGLFFACTADGHRAGAAQDHPREGTLTAEIRDAGFELLDLTEAACAGPDPVCQCLLARRPL